MTALVLMFACAHNPGDPATNADLSHRAYAVSRDSNNVMVFDYATMERLGDVDASVGSAAANGDHMAMVRPDGKEIYVSAAAKNALVVIDATTLRVKKTISLGNTPTHQSVRAGTNELWVMEEGDNAIAVIDMATDTLTRTITDPSFAVPHFAHFAGDRAYIANIGGSQISVVDLSTYRVVDTLLAAGVDAPGACSGDDCGFADAQITPAGLLYATHIATGTTMVYDTVAEQRLPDVVVGGTPWSAFVDPFGASEDALVPSWTLQTVTRLGRDGAKFASVAGDSQVYGVNYSPTDDSVAFVLDRTAEQVSVIDRATGDLVDALDVGGNTETGTTTPEGQLLLPISSAGELVVLDTATREELGRFTGVGTYPWSVTTMAGQNYCH
jgi:YVTN family beta-propeller protein